MRGSIVSSYRTYSCEGDNREAVRGGNDTDGHYQAVAYALMESGFF